MAKKSQVLKNIIKSQKRSAGPEFTYPELNEAAANLRTIPLGPYGTRSMPYGSERRAFGDLLNKSDFKKELRKLQEKYKISGTA